ncbi:aspartic proteinase CDR1 [Ricinus communis]|uniref:aspartic proteinase CDR1 n=1 Tax=Ricinus communis TaxID=3988 RepID=UPI00201A35E8|nr:aspartic proteinase CDR1 [Ricinus communis]
MEPNVAYHNFISFTSLIIILSTVFLSSFAIIQADKFSFTAELIHIDSPNSPFFNASETTTHRLAKALQRSANRVARLNPLSNSDEGVHASIFSGDGNYLMKLLIGTPPTEIHAAIDTGSNVIWIPCINCKDCFNQSSSIFNPLASSTYQDAPCDSYQCETTSSSCQSDNVCLYSCDEKHQLNCPNGRIAVDTMTLTSSDGRPFPLPYSDFVCGNSIYKTFAGVGVIGLGRGALSLTSKLYHLSDGKFSYCLADYYSKQPSKINFGLQSFISDDDLEVVSTTLGHHRHSGKYYVTLEGISVGEKRQDLYYVDDPFAPPVGNMLIDSGTMFTLLPKDFYDYLWSTVSYAIPENPQNHPHNSRFPFSMDNTLKLSPCFWYYPELKFPKITIHFTDADVELSDDNSFIRVAEDVVCFAFAATQPGQSTVYGSWQQMNFILGYDLKRGTVSFKRTDCSKL